MHRPCSSVKSRAVSLDFQMACAAKLRAAIDRLYGPSRLFACGQRDAFRQELDLTVVVDLSAGRATSVRDLIVEQAEQCGNFFRVFRHEIGPFSRVVIQVEKLSRGQALLQGGGVSWRAPATAAGGEA